MPHVANQCKSYITDQEWIALKTDPPIHPFRNHYHNTAEPPWSFARHLRRFLCLPTFCWHKLYILQRLVEFVCVEANAKLRNSFKILFCKFQLLEFSVWLLVFNDVLYNLHGYPRTGLWQVILPCPASSPILFVSRGFDASWITKKTKNLGFQHVLQCLEHLYSRSALQNVTTNQPFLARKTKDDHDLDLTMMITFFGWKWLAAFERIPHERPHFSEILNVVAIQCNGSLPPERKSHYLLQ